MAMIDEAVIIGDGEHHRSIDIVPVTSDPVLFAEACNDMYQMFEREVFDTVIASESSGTLFASVVAEKTRSGVVVAGSGSPRIREPPRVQGRQIPRGDRQERHQGRDRGGCPQKREGHQGHHRHRRGLRRNRREARQLRGGFRFQGSEDRAQRISAPEQDPHEGLLKTIRMRSGSHPVARGTFSLSFEESECKGGRGRPPPFMDQ